MSHEKITALIAEARLMAESSALGGREKLLFFRLADALEASLQDSEKGQNDD